MRIRYTCHYGALTGYGRAARDYLAALHNVDGLELEIAVLGESLTSPEPSFRHLDHLAVPHQVVEGVPDVEVFHVQPRILDLVATGQVAAPDYGRARPKRVALTTWETSALPERYARALAAFDRVIVPSDFCAELVDHAHAALMTLDSTVKVRPLSHVVPHCFDEERWPKPERRDRESGDPYRFYSIGAWGERKNMLGVLRAYLHEFSSADNVHLLMVIADADFDEIRSLIARSGLPQHELPGITIPYTALTEAQLMELHATVDCFVTATRGEGFGLGLFEAAIMGRQIIAPLYGGQNDFLDEYSGAQGVGYRMTPCFGTERARFGADAVGVAIAPGVDCRQLWAEPDLSSLAAFMRDAMNGIYKTGTRMRSMRSDREILERRFGYKAVGPMFANLLREIAGT